MVGGGIKPTETSLPLGRSEGRETAHLLGNVATDVGGFDTHGDIKPSQKLSFPLWLEKKLKHLKKES